MGFSLEINVIIVFIVKFYIRQCSYLKFPKFRLWSVFIWAPHLLKGFFWNVSKLENQFLKIVPKNVCVCYCHSGVCRSVINIGRLPTALIEIGSPLSQQHPTVFPYFAGTCWIRLCSTFRNYERKCFGRFRFLKYRRGSFEEGSTPPPPTPRIS